MEINRHWMTDAIGMFVLSCIFGGIALSIYPGFPIVGKFLDENIKLSMNAPAWVQAFGSLMMLAIAVGLPMAEKISRKNEAIKFAHNYFELTHANIRVAKDSYDKQIKIEAICEGCIAHQEKLDELLSRDICAVMPIRVIQLVHAMQILSDQYKKSLKEIKSMTHWESKFMNDMKLFTDNSDELKKKFYLLFNNKDSINN